MLTLRNPRLDATQAPREKRRERSTLAYGLALWAIAMICVASLGDACAAGSCSCVASFSAGLL